LRLTFRLASVIDSLGAVDVVVFIFAVLVRHEARSSCFATSSSTCDQWDRRGVSSRSGCPNRLAQN
jgi:hypothetical protein